MIISVFKKVKTCAVLLLKNCERMIKSILLIPWVSNSDIMEMLTTVYKGQKNLEKKLKDIDLRQKRLEQIYQDRIVNLDKLIQSQEQKLDKQFQLQEQMLRKELNKQMQLHEQILQKKISQEKYQMRYEYYSRLEGKAYEKEVSFLYKERTGKILDLKNPKTFNEKIQWLKLYDSTPQKTVLTDKYLVRSYVKEKIGDKYLVPLLGVWDNFEEIDFESMPKQFVLKATHGCGWNIIIKDKDNLDKAEVKNKIQTWIKKNYAFYLLELHYMNIKPRIIAEAYLENKNDDLYDYKVFCFNGKAESIMFLCERKQGLKMAFYDTNWKKLSFAYDYPIYEEDVPKPQNLGLIIELAEKLAQGFAHVRIDFYILNDGSVKFGEMTFTSSNGTCKWYPPEQDLIYGELIKLPKKGEIPSLNL